MKKLFAVAALLLLTGMVYAQDQIELKWNKFKIEGEEGYQKTGGNNVQLRELLSVDHEAHQHALESRQWGLVKYYGYGSIAIGYSALLVASEMGLSLFFGSSDGALLGLYGVGFMVGGAAAVILGAANQREYLRRAVKVYNKNQLPNQSYQPYLKLDGASDKPGLGLYLDF